MSAEDIEEALILIMEKLVLIGEGLFAATLEITKNQKEIAKMIQAINKGKGYDASIKVLSDKKFRNSKLRGKRNG